MSDNLILAMIIGIASFAGWVYKIKSDNRKLKAEANRFKMSVKEQLIYEEEKSLSDEVLADRLRAMAADARKERERRRAERK